MQAVYTASSQSHVLFSPRSIVGSHKLELIWRKLIWKISYRCPANMHQHLWGKCGFEPAIHSSRSFELLGQAEFSLLGTRLNLVSRKTTKCVSVDIKALVPTV